MNKEDVVRGLMREHLQLLGVLHAIVRDSALAEDLFQELVILAMQKHEQIDESESKKPKAKSAGQSRLV